MGLPDREIRMDLFLWQGVGEHSGIREAVIPRVADDNVVQHADSKDFAGLNESGRAITVLTTRGGIPARMRVSAYDRRTAGDYGCSEHHIGNDDARTDTALRYEIDSDQPVFIVQQENVKLLTIDIGVKLLPREFKHLPGIAEDFPAAAERAVADQGNPLSWNTVVN
jgi:hypothetical protein